MVISDAVEEYLLTRQNSITHDTFEFYRIYLGQFAEWCTTNRLTELSQINAGHVQQFANANPKHGQRTRHHKTRIVKTFLQWCSEDEDMGVRSKVVSRVEMPVVEHSSIDLFTEEDIKKLFAACLQMKQPKRNLAIVHLLLDTGLRASEVCYDGERPEETTGLLMEGLVLDRRGGDGHFVRVIGKGRKPRQVGLGQQTALAIKRYLNHERGYSPSPYVFLSSHGDDEPLSVRMLQQFLGELGELAGVEGVHAHRFRHTFAVEQLLSGTSDMVLMRLLGHSTLESTKLYTRAMTEQQAMRSASSVVNNMVNRSKGGRNNEYRKR